MIYCDLLHIEFVLYSSSYCEKYHIFLFEHTKFCKANKELEKTFLFNHTVKKKKKKN